MASSEQNFNQKSFSQLSLVNQSQEVKIKEISQFIQNKKQQISSSDGQNEQQNLQCIKDKQKTLNEKVSLQQNVKEYFDEMFPQYQHGKRSSKLSTKPQQSYRLNQITQYFNQQTLQNLPLIESEILQNGVFQKTQLFTDQLLVIKSQHTKYYQVISLQIQLSFYKTKIHILNSKLPSQIHNVAYFEGFGGFGNVYFSKFQLQEYAIKCIHFDKKIQNQQKIFEVKKSSLISTLKQYFFILLFSQLQIGPKVKKIFGFDLIVYQDCIEFSTEICQKRKLSENEIMNLKESLKKMHILNFVHRDIKPGNILYSPTFGKYIFIDFGSCSCLQESLGQKTFTNFVGTAGFCTPQLINLIGKKGFVDLYFNDIYGLKKTCSTNLNQTLPECTQYKIQLKNIENPYLQWNLIKYLIFNRKFQEFLKSWRKIQKYHLDHLQQLQFLLLEFLIDIPPDDFLRSFYWNQITQRVRNLKEFQNLKNTYSLNKNDALWAWKLDSYKEIHFKQLTLFYNYFLNQSRPYFFFIKLQQQKPTNHQQRIYQIDFILSSHTQIYIFSFIQNFQDIKILFDLSLNFNEYLDQKLDKQISKILTNKNNIEAFIFPSHEYLKKLQIKQIQSPNSKDSLVIYFLVVVNYTTLVQNRYNCSFQNKLKASKIANELIQNFNDEEFIKMDPLFQPYSSDFQPLIKMLQYFIFHLLNKVPQKFKQKSMTNSYSSLLLLGYPVYLPYQNSLILYQFIKEHQKNRIQAILAFWQSILISIHFGNILINRSYKRKQISYLQKQKMVDQQIEKVFGPDQNSQQSFFNINHQFFVKLYANQKKLRAKDLQEATQKLNQFHTYKNISRQNYYKWKNMMLFLIRFLKFMHEIYDHKEETQDFIIQKKATIFGEDINSMPTFIETAFSKSQVYTFSRKFNQILEIVDRIINNQNISQRYFTDNRIISAYFQRDTQKLKKLLNLIIESVQNYSILNILSLCGFTSFIHQIISLQTDQGLSNYFVINPQYVLDFQIFEDILQLTLKMAEFFCITNTKQVYQFIDSHNSRDPFTVKNVYFLFNSLQNMLFKLRLIYEMIQNLQVKRSFISSSDQLKINPIRKLQKNGIILERIMNCMNKSQLIRKTQKIQFKNVSEKNNYVHFMMNLYINNKEYNKAVEIFQQKFGSLAVSEINNSMEQMIPLQRLFVIYKMLKIRMSQFQVRLYEDLIEIYKHFNKQNEILDPKNHPQFYQKLFEAFLYCQKSFQQIEQFLNFMTNSFRISCSSANADDFHMIFKRKLWCLCQECFKPLPLNWKPYLFIQYINDRLSTYSPNQNCYMSLIFYEYLEWQDLPYKIKKNFVNFTLKSVEYLSSTVRTIVIRRIYQIAFQIYDHGKGIKDFFSQLQKRFYLKNYKDRKLKNFVQNQQNLLFQIKSRFDKKVIKKSYHFYQKSLQNNKNNLGLEYCQYQFNISLIYNFQQTFLQKDDFFSRCITFRFSFILNGVEILILPLKIVKKFQID